MEILLAIVLTWLTFVYHPSLKPVFHLPSLPPVSAPTPLPTLSPASPTPVPHYSAPDSADPWGVAIRIGDHTYHIRITNDPVMGTPDEILMALNNYRVRNGVQPLQNDPRLSAYAQQRAEYFTKIQATDAHAGFIDYLDNHNGFIELGYRQLGENSSFGYVMSGVHLIEFIYKASPDHNANQLESKWDHAGVGVSGSATDLLFATSPL